jgi:hypothetical protein
MRTRALSERERRWLAWSLLLAMLLLVALRPLVLRPVEPRVVSWNQLATLMDGRDLRAVTLQADRVVGSMREEWRAARFPEEVAAPWPTDVDRSAFADRARARGIAVTHGSEHGARSLGPTAWIALLVLFALFYWVAGGGKATGAGSARAPLAAVDRRVLGSGREVVGRVHQREMREGLGEVSQKPPRSRIVLLR